MTEDQYDKVLMKAELKGASTLTKNELEIFKKLLKEISARGNRARRLVD